MEKIKQYQIATSQRFIAEIERLKQRGLQQYRTAELLETTPSVISDIKNGSQYATLEMICRMVEIFGTDANWLLTGKRAKSTPQVRQKVA